MKLPANQVVAALFSLIPSSTIAWLPSNHVVDYRYKTRTSSPTSSSKLNMSIPNSFDTLTSGLASIARLSFGIDVTTTTSKPSPSSFRIKELYDVESSRACRMVRERITELDLVVDTVIPAASNSRAINDLTNGGLTREFGVVDVGTPCMVVVVDESSVETTKKLVGSDEILSYLDQTFGTKDDTGADPPADTGELAKIFNKITPFLNNAASYLPPLLRYGKGNAVASCALSPNTPRPTKPLTLYSYEGNQFCRLVREVLTEIDVPYELRSAGKQSPRRAELAAITGGSSQCPFLIDPNTGVQLSESVDIVQYLYKNYALWTPPSELLQSVERVYAPVVKPLFAVLAPLQAGSSYTNQDDNDSQAAYDLRIQSATSSIQTEIESNAVVIYTYELSPFCTEATKLLDSLDISYKEISLGLEWIPGLIAAEGGAETRAALGVMTGGQTSLPHVFVGGESVGGLFSSGGSSGNNNQGLVPLLEKGALLDMVEKAESSIV